MDSQAPFGLPQGATFGGRYRVIRCIKAGGMGAIYEVVHLDTRRHRALKVMLPGLADDPEVRARFEREATIASSIRSDHVVDVQDAGVDAATDMPFLTMELLDGMDLMQLVRERGRLSAEEVVALLSQAARGLDKVHAAGIVHRDLKPHNLFLARRDDGAPLVKVLDFGVARLAVQAERSASIVGSPLYMPREQVQGEGTIGPRADVYALAHVAFTLLVGSAYWSREQRRADNTFALLLQSTKGLPESATARAAAEGASLPPAFDAWFARATAIEPSERHASAGELCADLASALGVTPTDVVPTRLHPPAVLRKRGGRRGWIAALLASMLVVAGGAWVGIRLLWSLSARSCVEIHNASPDRPDGEYEIRAGEGGGAPVRVYCHDMAGSPREYLTLARSRATGAGDANCSHYGAGPNTSPGGVTTCFTRVRFLPGELAIDVADSTFAIKVGGEAHFGKAGIDVLSYGDAGDCVGANSHTGKANIDLTGTPFTVPQDQFVLSGFAPAGDVKVSAEGQVADLEGGGYCGGIGTPKRPGSAPSPLKLGWLHRD